MKTSVEGKTLSEKKTQQDKWEYGYSRDGSEVEEMR